MNKKRFTQKKDKVYDLILKEEKRQKDTLMLIPSENYSSLNVRRAVGSVLAHKYSEGYPGKRYYQGNGIVDEIENLAIERAKKLFKVPHVNVQPYSGSPANAEVLFALLPPGEKVMGMGLSSGGHLTHGYKDITFSGKYFKSVQYNLDDKAQIDYDKVYDLAKKEKPKLIFAGITSYPRTLNWQLFSDIADSVGAWLVADISHIAGLIAGGVYLSPVKYAHVITSTTHKTLRGPRGAMIMVTQKGLDKDGGLAYKIDRSVFPGMQGGPHNNTTAAIAVALGEAMEPEFKKYVRETVKNANALSEKLIDGGLDLLTGGTDCHLLVIDLRKQELSGSVVSEALEKAGIIVNKNLIPGDMMPALHSSGIRLGTPAVTTRKMTTIEMELIGEWILEVIKRVSGYKLPGDESERNGFMKRFREDIEKDKTLFAIRKKVKMLCDRYPIQQ